ncbi:MAG: hypothetical protein KF770_29090 [Anaerolineae bacterium]|nr:hypothetical protein [Anaerolineae bacterium]
MGQDGILPHTLEGKPMGITINYEGNLDDPGKVWEFITHMMFKANEWGWPNWEVNERIIGHAYYQSPMKWQIRTGRGSRPGGWAWG